MNMKSRNGSCSRILQWINYADAGECFENHSQRHEKLGREINAPIPCSKFSCARRSASIAGRSPCLDQLHNF